MYRLQIPFSFYLALWMQGMGSVDMERRIQAFQTKRLMRLLPILYMECKTSDHTEDVYNPYSTPETPF